MRNRRASRTWTLEALEDRLVLAAPTSPAAAIVAEQAAVASYAVGYFKAVDQYLATPSTPDRAGFNTQVTSLLDTLSAELIQDIEGLGSSTLASTIQGDVLGSGNGSNSLLSKIEALPTPSTGMGGTSVAAFDVESLVAVAATDAKIAVAIAHSNKT